MTRVGLLGCGAIGTFILESIEKGWAGDARVVAVAGRGSAQSRTTAQRFDIPYVDPADLPTRDPRVIVEAAGHSALQTYVGAYLGQGIDVITLSAGALADGDLGDSLLRSAAAGGAQLHVPSGGIAGLDGIKALAPVGTDVTITTTKPPQAWKGVDAVEALGIDLDRMSGPVVLFEGPARQACVLFPQNVNVAAALSLAGSGFDRTHVRVVVDPHAERNIHDIVADGPLGRIWIKVENVPTPANPKTAYLAGLSAVAILRQFSNPLRIGT